jgi:hypothetical protein
MQMNQHVNIVNLQPNLFDYPLEQPTEPSCLGYSWADRFEIFHRDNPRIYYLIRNIAFDLKSSGFKKCSMGAIFHKIRWEYCIQTKGEKYRLNNNFTRYYSRLLMQQEPELEGFFEVRNANS